MYVGVLKNPPECWNLMKHHLEISGNSQKRWFHKFVFNPQDCFIHWICWSLLSAAALPACSTPQSPWETALRSLCSLDTTAAALLDQNKSLCFSDHRSFIPFHFNYCAVECTDPNHSNSHITKWTFVWVVLLSPHSETSNLTDSHDLDIFF